MRSLQGVGLRPTHYASILERRPDVGWFEAITENYMDSGGRPIDVLEKIRAQYPVALHGVSLSIGSSDPLDPEYLSRWKRLIDRIDPFIVSDHLCWTSTGGHQAHDLLPMPYTEAALSHVVDRVQAVQETLGRPLHLENVSSYVSYRHSEMPEWEFLAQIAARSGCKILLDLNNIHVSAFNHGFDPLAYLEGIPAGTVGQFHLAGYTDMGEFYFDTHSAPVVPAVWDLYARAVAKYGKIPTLIEWDEEIPSLDRLLAESRIAHERMEKTLNEKRSTAA